MEFAWTQVLFCVLSKCKLDKMNLALLFDLGAYF